MENLNLIITPKTKVLQLIETYPQLENVLIGYIPSFSKLKNPILRKTVARIATLQQAAAVGHVEVADLINILRKSVGQESTSESILEIYHTLQPGWFDEEHVVMELDVREMLTKGEHPVNQITSDLLKLENHMIYKLIAPFLPAPLIDKATSLQFEHWIDKQSDDLYVIYFCKAHELRF
jgi:hypothetical protein